MNALTIIIHVRRRKNAHFIRRFLNRNYFGLRLTCHQRSRISNGQKSIKLYSMPKKINENEHETQT